mgnify:FL=1
MPTITITTNSLQSLLAYAAVVQIRDHCTHGHMWRVSQYASLLSEKAGFSPGEVFISSLGGMVHDIGKIGVPDRILQKPGRLKNDEIAVIRQHPRMGIKLIQDHPLASIVGNAILEHHERIDGSGYPDHRGGEQISVFARVVAIADAFDAMTSPRSYRAVKSVSEACDVIMREKDRQFDPTLAEIFVEMALHGEMEFITGHSLNGRRMVSCMDCGPVIGIFNDVVSGEVVTCPRCGKRYRLHPYGSTCELEWLGNYNKAGVRVEVEAIEEFIRYAPKSIRI